MTDTSETSRLGIRNRFNPRSSTSCDKAEHRAARHDDGVIDTQRRPQRPFEFAQLKAIPAAIVEEAHRITHRTLPLSRHAAERKQAGDASKSTRRCSAPHQRDSSLPRPWANSRLQWAFSLSARLEFARCVR
jgi:hypothetical protein